MRNYERTHPWKTFNLDLRKFNHKIWLLLGEAQSKCEHISGIPLLPSISKQLHKIYLAKGVLATTAIEGNTLTEIEVQDIIDKKLILQQSKRYLQQEVENIVDACNLIKEKLLDSKEYKFTIDDIKTYNYLVLKNLNLDFIPGEIRNISVGVGSYRGAPPEDCEYLLNRLCDWLNSEEFYPLEGHKIAFGILKAIVAHLYLAWIHPFQDGNGRTARLVEFLILLDSGIPTPAAHLLSDFFNQTRMEYYRQLKNTTQKKDGDIVPFIEYAVQGFVDGLKEQIKFIQLQQINIIWRDFIRWSFEEKKGKAELSKSDQRRLGLMCQLPIHADPISISKLKELSAKVANLYAGVTTKTLRRDLNILSEMDLIIENKIDKTIKPNWEVILSFLPARRSKS